MDTNAWYALLAPLLLLLVVSEALILRTRGEQVHVLPDTLSNLACGLGGILFGLFTAALLLGLYGWFQRHFAILHWAEGSRWPWVLAFPLTDLCYYLFHRASHRVTLFWAIHEVHHQSEQMNVSVALRQTWFSDFTSLLFYWPLPLLGIPEEAFFVAVAGLSVYQSLQHTRLFRGIGWWGLVFNTPSTHRIHHARDLEYRDHNYASTLVVWDRLFGTFVRETKAPTFGTVDPFKSWNPLWAQAAPFVALSRRLRGIPRVADRLKALVLPPEWLAPGEERSLEQLAPTWNGAPAGGPTLAAYATTQFFLAGTGGLFVIGFSGALGLPLAGTLGAFVVVSSVAIGGLFEDRSWGLPLELARLVVLIPLGLLASSRVGGPMVAWILVAYAVTSLGALAILRSRFTPAPQAA